MNSSELPASNFAPLPLRARGPMEVLDISVRVYKQYFWTLLAWSALVVVGGVVLAFLPGGGLVAFLLYPLLTGACVCAIAAAVRGQAVNFKQCGDFSKSRYGPMLGMYVLSALVAGGIIIVGAIVVGLAVVALSSLGDSSASMALMVVLGIIGLIASLWIFSCLTIWLTFVQIVVCMEEDKRGTPALRRAFDLLRGHWVRISMLFLVVGLAILTVLAILAVLSVMVVGIGSLRDVFNGQSLEGDGAFWGIVIAWGAAYIAFQIVCNPLVYITLGMFYLDVRIRKEALDLEWTAHTTTPAEMPFDSAPANVWNTASTVENAPTFVAMPQNAPAAPANNSWYDALPATPAAPVPHHSTAPVATVAQRVICHHCGASVVPAEICSNCGTRLPVLPNSTTLLDATTDTTPPNYP